MLLIFSSNSAAFETEPTTAALNPWKTANAAPRAVTVKVVLVILFPSSPIFELIPFSAVVALLDKFEKPEPSELAILVATLAALLLKLVRLLPTFPTKELLIVFEALLTFELIVLNAELTLLDADVAKLETELVAFVKAF